MFSTSTVSAHSHDTSELEPENSNKESSLVFLNMVVSRSRRSEFIQMLGTLPEYNDFNHTVSMLAMNKYSFYDDKYHAFWMDVLNLAKEEGIVLSDKRKHRSNGNDNEISLLLSLREMFAPVHPEVVVMYSMMDYTENYIEAIHYLIDNLSIEQLLVLLAQIKTICREDPGLIGDSSYSVVFKAYRIAEDLASTGGIDDIDPYILSNLLIDVKEEY